MPYANHANQRGLVFLAVADVSGSMLGAPLTSAQSALNEISYELAEIRRKFNVPILFGLLTFHETMRWECPPMDVLNLPSIVLSVRKEPGSPFYPVTLYQRLFQNLLREIRSDKFAPCRGLPLYACLITDGKPADEDSFPPVAARILQEDEFGRAQRYVILTGDGDPDAARKNTLLFAENDPKRIVSGEEVTKILTAMRGTARDFSGRNKLN